jgi:LacI family transcriptional regulator
MKLTMKDIAKMANVSMTTVSLVLNNKKARISQKKINEIKKIAADNNYIPNSSAVSLATNESKTIGVVVPNIGNPFYSLLLKAISDALKNRGYYALIINTNDNHDDESQQVQKLISRGVDGILLVPSNDLFSQGSTVVTEFLKDISLPFVLVNAETKLKINQINFDSVEGGFLATQLLIQKGHKKIAIITGEKGYVNADDRLKGYKKALEQNHIDFDSNLVFRGKYDIQSGNENITKIIKDTEATAIFFCNDLMLYGAMQKMNQLKLNLFDRYSIIGYDDTFFNEIFNPEVSSVKQDVNKLGSDAVIMMLDAIKNKVVNQSKLRVEVNDRESVKQL